MESLASAILLRALKDWSDPRRQADVERFLDSEWFNSLAQSVGLEPNAIRRKWKDRRFEQLQIRAAYR